MSKTKKGEVSSLGY